MEATQFNGNINKTTTPNLRKFEDPSFVLNAVRDDILGNKPSYQSEPGNNLAFTVSGRKLIGEIYGEDSEVYLFHTDGNGNDLIGVSTRGKYEILVEADFGFTLTHPIVGVYKVVNGCEKTIYWCDAQRPDRYFNRDRVDDFKINGNWNVESFSLRPNIVPPKIDVISVADSGGSLPAGKYFIQVEILDSRATGIFKTGVSNGVNIYADNPNQSYNQINGNYNIEGFTPAEGGKPLTSKAILYNITGLDPVYKYIRINVIRATTGNGTTLQGFVKSDLIPITGDTVSFTLSGIMDTDIIEDVAKFLVPTAKYYSSEYMKIVGNRLVRGGVNEIARDYSLLQRAASKIGTRYKILEVPAEDAEAIGNAKNPLTPYNAMSLMGDEVIGLGVVYLYNDGTEAPPMHIPGVCKDFIQAPPIMECERCIKVQVYRSGLGEGTVNAEVVYTIDGVEDTWTLEDVFPEGEFYYEEIIVCSALPIVIISATTENIDDPEFLLDSSISASLVDDEDCAATQCLYLAVDPIGITYETTDITVEYTVNGVPDSFVLNGWNGSYYTSIVCSNYPIVVTNITVSKPDNFNVTTEIGDPVIPPGPDVPGDWHSAEIEKSEDENAEHIIRYELNSDGSFKLDINGNLIERTTLERWEIYNTALKTGAFIGYNGYHEISSKKYPEILACDGEDIWGEDICGRPLAGTSIRHHRIVDRRIEPHYTATGFISETERYNIVVTITSPDPPEDPTPITVEISYEVDGNPFTITRTYFNLGEPEALVLLEDEPTNVVITIIDPGTGNGAPLTTSFEVTVFTNTVNNTANAVVRLIGLEFYNVEYPDPSIVGHYFVIADYENTVVAKGYSTPIPKMDARTSFDNHEQYIHGFTSGSVDAAQISQQQRGDREAFITPEYLFDRRYITGDHYKNEQGNMTIFEQIRSKNVDQGNIFSSKTDLAIVARDRALLPSTLPSRHNSPISECIAVNAQSDYLISTQSKTITNYSLNNKLFSFRSNNGSQMDQFIYGAIKVDKDVYTDIFSIKYRKLHTNHFSLDQTRFTVFGGAYYISRFPYINLMFAGYKGSLLGEIIGVLLLGAVWVLIKAIQNLIDGDPTEWERIKYGYIGKYSKFNGVAHQLEKQMRKSKNRCIGYISDSMDNMYYESRINTSLNNESTDPDREIYRGGISLSYLLRMVSDRYEDEEGKTYFFPKKTGVAEYFYSYNKDYSKLKDFQNAYSLPPTYNYCSECIGRFPSRTVWSPVSLDEDVFDTFRIALAADYKDYPAHKGSIKGLSYRSGKLLTHTTQTTFILPVTQQEMRTSAESVYISSGSFMSLEPIELMEANIGFVGLQDKMALKSTPYGDVWWDSRKGLVMMFSQQAKLLSMEGLPQWFLENSESQYKEYFRNLGVDVPLSIADKTGYQIVYDPRFYRVILTKKDYLPIVDNIPLQVEEPAFGDLRYTLDGRIEKYMVDEFYLPGAPEWLDVPFTDKEVYRRDSFTLSYSLEYQGWTSWHSYLPDFMYSDEFNYFTNIGANTYRHLHAGSFQNFYGTKYPFIVETIKSGVNTNTLNSIIYVGYTQIWNESLKQWQDVSQDITFNHIMVYNSDCNTGLLNVNFLDQDNDFYGNIAYVPDTVTCIRTDNNYKISGLYDYSNAVPVVSGGWNEIKSVIDDYGYIDIVPYNININKSQYELADLRGKYYAVRLFFNPVEDARKVIHLMVPSENISMR
jgi:hypothetical protein